MSWRYGGATVLFIFVGGCANIPPMSQEECLSEIDDDIVAVQLILAHTLANPSATFNLACDNVYGTNASSDWQQSNITATTSISIIKNKSCRLTLHQYFDGTSTFTPLSSNNPLVIFIASNGSVTTTSALQYTDGATPTPNLQWFIAGQNGAAYTVVINYAADALTATQSITPTVLSIKTMSLSFAQIVAPSVSSVTVTETKSHGPQYTLTATVSGSTTCKYIDNSGSPAPHTASNWISVNSAYNNASAKTCPVITPGSPLLQQGNWNSLWKSNITTLVIWANTQNGISAYTTSNVGPP